MSKICIISNLYEPYNRGGAEQVVKNIVEGLRDRGDEVVLITAMPFSVETGFKPVSIIAGSIKIYRFYPLNIFFYANDYKHNAIIRLIWHFLDIFNLHSYFVIKNILRRERPDLVLTHNLKGLGYLIPKAIKKLNIKHIHTIHDIQLASPSGLMIKVKENDWSQASLLVKLYGVICRWLFKDIKVVISPSNWLLKYYNDRKFFSSAKKNILRNPVSEQTQTLRACRDRLLESESPPRINFLFVGQIEKHKGILFLIETFKSIFRCERNSKPNSVCYSSDLNLHIVGDGSVLNKAKQLANNDPHIIFYGKLPHSEVMEQICNTNFVVVPSLCYENSPNIVVEALSVGKPVVVADIGGTAELVNDNNGLKFEAGNQDDLIKKINLAIERKNDFDTDNIKKSLNNLSIEDYIDSILNII